MKFSNFFKGKKNFVKKKKKIKLQPLELLTSDIPVITLFQCWLFISIVFGYSPELDSKTLLLKI